MRLADHIADAINESREYGYGSVAASDIKKVRFRRGCAEIEVQYLDHESLEEATIDAAPVLTHILMGLMHAAVL